MAARALLPSARPSVSMVPARHPGHAPATAAGRTAHAAHLCALMAVETATALPLKLAPATVVGVPVAVLVMSLFARPAV